MDEVRKSWIERSKSDADNGKSTYREHVGDISYIEAAFAKKQTDLAEVQDEIEDFVEYHWITWKGLVALTSYIYMNLTKVLFNQVYMHVQQNFVSLE